MPEKHKKYLKKLKELPLPEDIKFLFFSEAFENTLADICLSHKIKDEESQKQVGYQVGKVLIGNLPPKDFINALKKNTELSPPTAASVGSEIDNRIFSVVRESLNTLYKEKGELSEKTPKEKPPKEEPSPKKSILDAEKTKETDREKKDSSKEEDVYRESIE